MSKLKILQTQMPVSADKEENLSAAERACRAAVSEGADLVALPEMFCCPYDTANFPLYAEGEDGPVLSRCQSLAKTYGLYLSAGSVPEKGEDDTVYNTAYVFDREGRQIAKHRKAHLFDIDVKGGQTFRESDTLSPGNSVTTFDTEFGVLGLCVCYDFRFPEMGRLMAARGARLILVPAAFNPTTGPAHWELMFRAQSMFSQVFTVGTAPAPDLAGTYRSWGHSIAVDPWGSVLAQMGTEAGYQTVELDLAETDSVRSQLPLIAPRRTDLYTLKENSQ